MSQINCYGTEKLWCEIIPDWYLVQIVDVVGEYNVGNHIMKDGDFGLTISNDPEFVFEYSPLLDVSDEEMENMTKDEFDKLCEKEKYYRQRIDCSCQEILIAHKFVESCIKAGYDSSHGSVGCWFATYLTKKMEKIQNDGPMNIWKKVGIRDKSA